MLCRTSSDSALIGSAAAVTGAPARLVEKAFHALRREGERLAVSNPNAEDVIALLRARRDLLNVTDGVPAARGLLYRIGLSQAREDAEGGLLPDGASWYAWQRILAEAEERVAVARREAAIFDIDGTLSDNEPMRDVPLPPPGPAACYDEWMSHTVDLDVNEWVRNATHEVGDNVEKVVLTARSEKYRDLTVAWLTRHDVRYDRLVMRPNDDKRPDHVYKQQALDELERHFDVIFAIDDNPDVAQMWADNNIDTIVVPGFAHTQAPPPPGGLVEA